MKAVEIRGMTPAELETKLEELKKELFNLRFQHATNQLTNPGKDIARVKTIIREKQTASAGR